MALNISHFKQWFITFLQKLNPKEKQFSLIHFINTTEAPKWKVINFTTQKMVPKRQKKINPFYYNSKANNNKMNALQNSKVNSMVSKQYKEKNSILNN